jgi:2-oxoglutarate dehydrogenase E1 component
VDFSGLANYTTGGTVHIIVNNQIGFTTDPISSRGSIYCTDLAKAAGAPIFHVNGDNVEAVVHVFRLAAEWRQRFNKDVFIDLICYRKFGHNELDEPKFTQPLMYKAIEKKVPALNIYIEQLLKEGVVTNEEVKEMENRVHGILEHAYAAASTYKPGKMEWIEKFNLEPPLPEIKKVTGIDKQIALSIGQGLCKVPEGFNLHPTLKRMLQAKHKMFETGEGLDWGTCEALAFGSLLLEGIHVRLSGQDVERGTFSHRHAVLHDQQTGQRYVPLNHIAPSQAEFIATNSSLSEFGVLGFELGYSLENRYKSLVLWEAQFGDFANSAQIIFDQFLSSQEAKWGNQSGLVRRREINSFFFFFVLSSHCNHPFFFYCSPPVEGYFAASRLRRSRP